MSIEQLVVSDFRNLRYGKYELDKHCNFVIGDNGSGKSSFLEAIFYLAHGKSFRTNRVDSIVCHEKDQVVVSAKDETDVRLGIRKNFVTGDTEIKVNDERCNRLSDLAKNIAVQIVTPESFKLFFGGPKERRKFFELGLFHVKHEFSETWRQFNRVLKQRNACLRMQADGSTLNYWTQLFCQMSEQISNFRQEYVDLLTEELNDWLTILLPNVSRETSVQYYQGWLAKKSLSEILVENETRERKQGFSLYGAQKFDVRFTVNGHPIENQLSRGQQKLFLLALTLAQTKAIEKVKQVKPILLIDDVGAELDDNSRRLLASAFERVESQIIITAIEEKVLAELTPTNNKFKMFHVEHGKLSEKSE